MLSLWESFQETFKNVTVGVGEDPLTAHSTDANRVRDELSSVHGCVRFCLSHNLLISSYLTLQPGSAGLW